MRQFHTHGGISVTAPWLLLLVTSRSPTEDVEILNCPVIILYTKTMSYYFRLCSKDGGLTDIICRCTTHCATEECALYIFSAHYLAHKSSLSEQDSIIYNSILVSGVCK